MERFPTTASPIAIPGSGTLTVGNCDGTPRYSVGSYASALLSAPPYIPPGVELAAVCGQCGKREKVTSPEVPHYWIQVTANGGCAVVCSFKCLVPYAIHEAQGGTR